MSGFAPPPPPASQYPAPPADDDFSESSGSRAAKVLPAPHHNHVTWPTSFPPQRERKQSFATTRSRAASSGAVLLQLALGDHVAANDKVNWLDTTDNFNDYLQVLDPSTGRVTLIHKTTHKKLMEPPREWGYGVDEAKNRKSAKSIFARAEQTELIEFFEKYDPMRVVEVDGLLDEYAGHEEFLFSSLERKYNVTGAGDGVVPGQNPAPAKPPRKKNSIFDKLTDTSMYTGASSHRFDKDGMGRGLTGRDRLHVGKGSHGAAHGADVFGGNTNDHRNRSETAGDTGTIDAADFLTRQW